MNFSDFYKNIKIIAIVGLSDKPDRPSYEVGQYLMEKGFRIIPVNPNFESVFGLKSYKSLKDIHEPVEVHCRDANAPS